jgi:glycosyltransferase involved in cell wall biosynthesis
MPPLVTIVTPVLDGARFLAELFASIAEQDYPAIEHIVVDGGSTDGTLDLLRARPGLAWTTSRDRGMYDAINRGFRSARGDIVGYQNADDRYADRGAVSRLVTALEEDTGADVVYGDFWFIDARGTRTDLWRSPEFDRRRLLRWSFVPPHSTLVRRRILDQGLWLDADLRFAGDWDWFVRIAQAGKRFVHLADAVSEFRRHPAAATARVPWARKLSEWRRICRKNGTPFLPLLWHEFVRGPARRRLGAGGASPHR